MRDLGPAALSSASELDLGPHLPFPAYVARESWQAQRVRAMAVYCSDGRWGEAFDEFCHQHLHIPRYDRCAMPGGPAALADTQKLGQVSWFQLDFLVEAHALERMVLIAHYGCGWYAAHLKQPPRECLAVQRRDLRKVESLLAKRYPALRVESYLAVQAGSVLSFYPLRGVDEARMREAGRTRVRTQART